MNAVRGRVRGTHVELDEPLPEGAEVVVLVGRMPVLTPEDRSRIDAARLAAPEAFVSHDQVLRELADRTHAGK